MKMVYAVFSLFMLFALLLSAKRGHLFFSLGALLVTYFLYGINKPTSRLFKIIFLLAIALLTLYVVSMFVPGILNALKRSNELLESGKLDAGRFMIQKNIYSFILNNLILGNGWEFFTYNNGVWFGQHAHNVYLQLLCDAGIIGFGIFVVIFSMLLFKSVEKLISSRRKKLGCICTKQEEWMLCSSICYQVFFLLYCTTGNPLYDRNCFFPYIMLSAAAISVSHKIERSRK